MATIRSFLALALRHPGHWPALVGLAWSVRRLRWWARPPFLPLPPADYLQWRDETAWREEAGPAEPGAPLSAADREALTLEYIRWTARMRRMVRRGGSV